MKSKIDFENPKITTSNIVFEQLPFLALYTLLDVVIYGLMVFASFYSAEFIVKVATIGELNFGKLMIALLYIIFSLLISKGLDLVKQLLLTFTSTRCQESTRKLLFRRLVHLDAESYANYETDEFVKKIIDSPNKLIKNIANLLDSLIICVAVFCVLVYIFTINVFIGLLLLASFAGLFIWKKYVGKMYKGEELTSNESRKNMYNLASFVMTTERDIKSLQIEKSVGAVLDERIENDGKHFRDFKFKFAFIDSLDKIIVLIVSILVIILSLYFYSKAMIALVPFIFIFSLQDRFINGVTSLNKLIDIVKEMNNDRMFLNQYLDEEIFKKESFGQINISEIKGDIAFEKVSFSYDFNQNKKHFILKDMSFEAKANTCVGVLMRQGSGKTTIINLITKLFKATKGKVTLDGMDILKLDKETIRENIALINENPFIFNDTLKRNLLCAKPSAEDDELLQVVKIAHLFDEKEDKDKLDILLNDKVNGFSIENKLKLSIARAILKNSQIILFDESSSPIENDAIEDIRDALKVLENEHTVIIVTQRFSLLSNINKIFYVENGSVVDSGNLKQLSERNKVLKAKSISEL